MTAHCGFSPAGMSGMLSSSRMLSTHLPMYTSLPMCSHAHLPPSPSHAPPFPPRCRSQGAGNVAKDIKYADIEPLFPWKPKWVPVVR